MSEQTVLVIRGSIDIPDPAAVGEQRRLAALSPGFSARTWQYTRRYKVGETIVLPPARSEALGAARYRGVCPMTAATIARGTIFVPFGDSGAFQIRREGGAAPRAGCDRLGMPRAFNSHPKKARKCLAQAAGRKCWRGFNVLGQCRAARLLFRLPEWTRKPLQKRRSSYRYPLRYTAPVQ